MDSAEPGMVLVVGNRMRIRGPVRRRGKPAHRRPHSFCFARSRRFLEYQAQEEDCAVLGSDPPYTAQRCARCDDTARVHRGSQGNAPRRSRGFRPHADWSGARNRARKHLAGMGTFGPARHDRTPWPQAPASKRRSSRNAARRFSRVAANDPTRSAVGVRPRGPAPPRPRPPDARGTPPDPAPGAGAAARGESGEERRDVPAWWTAAGPAWRVGPPRACGGGTASQRRCQGRPPSPGAAKRARSGCAATAPPGWPACRPMPAGRGRTTRKSPAASRSKAPHRRAHPSDLDPLHPPPTSVPHSRPPTPNRRRPPGPAAGAASAGGRETPGRPRGAPTAARAPPHSCRTRAARADADTPGR